MSGLVGLDGRELDADNPLVTPLEYVERKGSTAGFTKDQREFLRRNPPDPATDPATANPRFLSKSQRAIYGLRFMLEKASLDNLQLWTLVAALLERVGGTASFKQADVMQFVAPKSWPMVVADGAGNIRVALPGHDDFLTREETSGESAPDAATAGADGPQDHA